MRRRFRSYRLLVHAFLPILLASCSTERQCPLESLEIKNQWLTENATFKVEKDSAYLPWWEALQDPLLTDLIEKAVGQNLDLKIIASRVVEARRIARATEASLLPHLDASLNAGGAGFPQGILKDLADSRSSSHKQKKVSLFEAGFDASWEIDLFNLRKHEQNAALAQAKATFEELRASAVSLASEVARIYIEFRGIQKQQSLINERIEGERELARLTKDLQESGLIGIIEQWNQESSLSLLEAELPSLNLLATKALFKLSILLGKQPQELIVLMQAPGSLSLPQKELLITLPCDLLRQRPDVRQAEQKLIAAYEKVECAKANLYPRLSLVGFIGDITTKINKPGLTWYAGPSILAPIFNSKLLQEDVALNQEKSKQAFLRYQSTVLEALEETESALATYEAALKRHEMLRISAEKRRYSYDQTLVLYERGIKNYLEVIENQEYLIQSEKAFAEAEVEAIKAYIAIYKALGGGFCTHN